LKLPMPSAPFPLLPAAPAPKAHAADAADAPLRPRASGWLVLLLAYIVLTSLVALKYLRFPSIPLEFLVAAFHLVVALLAHGSLRSEWHFTLVASLLYFIPSDTAITYAGVFKYVAPALFWFGCIPSYMMFMWSVVYVTAIHAAYDTPALRAPPPFKAFAVCVLIYAVMEAFEPYLQIWQWRDYPSIVPVVVLEESLVGLGVAMLYPNRHSRWGIYMACGIPIGVIFYWMVGGTYPVDHTDVYLITAGVVVSVLAAALILACIGGSCCCCRRRARAHSCDGDSAPTAVTLVK